MKYWQYISEKDFLTVDTKIYLIRKKSGKIGLYKIFRIAPPCIMVAQL